MAFEYQGATITARELTIGDDDAIASVILSAVAAVYPNATNGAWAGFGTFVFGAVIEGESPLPPINRTSSPAEIVAAYDAWLKLPRWVARKWNAELQAVENPAPKA